MHFGWGWKGWEIMGDSNGVRGLKFGLLLAVVCSIAGCETAYYGAMEKVGVYKRDILVDRVEEAVDAQEDAKEEFASALEQFASVVEVKPSKLKSTYEDLADAFEDAEDEAQTVTDRVDAVENVSGDLFDEWRDEIEMIGNPKLKRASAKQLKTSERKYTELIRGMRRAEARMTPVLNTFRDHVLFLKHNLNAQAIASLKSEMTSIEADVAGLIREMEASIARSQAFIEDMEVVDG